VRPIELSVVMPVFNEGAAIEGVVADWLSILDSLGVRYEFIVLDDGSTDATAAILARLASVAPSLRIVRHDNQGHGPTILRGYAMTGGAWVLQIDGDGEIPPDEFPRHWARREPYDLVIGRRTNRSMPLVRRGVSAVSRASVRLLFGRGIGDVNVPYRLVRGALLRDRAATLPANLFAPNVILSGLAIRRGWRILEVPVAHVGRRHGTSSLGRFNVLRPAALSLWQTVRVALNDRARAAGR
jgi:glycosyltransferase involved in cell wall biosynthesis